MLNASDEREGKIMIKEISQRKELYKEFSELGITIKSLDPLPDSALQELLQAIKKAIGMARKDGML